MCKRKNKKAKVKEPPSQYVIICRTNFDSRTPGDEYRLSYNNLSDTYKKFLHTLWYYNSMNLNESVLCSVFYNNKIIYNYTKTKHKNELIDCLDGSKTRYELSIDELSKLILTAITDYETDIHNPAKK